MGLTNSTDSSSNVIAMTILRSILGFDMPSNTDSRVIEIRPLKSRSMNDVTAGRTREASVETPSLEIARRLQKTFQERYNWLVKKRESVTENSIDAIVPAKSIVAVVQQTMTEHKRKRNMEIETENEVKREKEEGAYLKEIAMINPTTSNREPWFVSQWYQSTNGARYGITIDTNNSEVMSYLKDFSDEFLNEIEEGDESIAEMVFNMKDGEDLVLKFNRWDPRTLDVLTQAMLESTGNKPRLSNQIDTKQMYSFVFVDNFGHKICCSLDINNSRVLKKLRMMEQWALQLADPCDLYDIKVEKTGGSITTLQLDLQNTTTIRNLKALKEESLTGKEAKLVNPIRKNEKVQKLLTSDRVSPSRLVEESQFSTAELFSPYTGPFTAAFDVSDKDTIRKFKKFNEEFRGSFYQFLLTIESTSTLDEPIVIRLDMANPKVVYELIMMTRKHSGQVVSFDPTIILNNLFTVLLPEDNVFLTLDISRSIVYGKLFDVANHQKKGVKLTIPCKGHLIHLFIDIANPKIVNKIRSLSLATIVPNNTRKISLMTLLFLNTSHGFTPISLDLADKKNVIEICKIVRNNPVGKSPAYVEVLDETGQFITVSLDLHNPNVVKSLTDVSKPAWFVSINATQSPYFAVCLPRENRYKTIRVRLKPVIIDELTKILAEYCPDYTLLEIFDSRRKCNIIYIDPTMPDLVSKFCSITNAVQILQPIEDNAATIYLAATNQFIDIDLSAQKTKKILQKLEGNYRPNKPLTVIKYYTFDKEVYAFVNVDEQFLVEMQKINTDMGRHIRLKNDIREKYVLKITDCHGSSIALKMNLANNRILMELDKLTNSEDSNIVTKDVYGYPIKVKVDTTNNAAINRLMALNEDISKKFIVN